MSFGPGWDFLDEQWDALYPGDDAPLTFRQLLPTLMPGACKQVVAWPAAGHWHLVAYGLTELFEKHSKIAAQDGWGFELTMRVPRDCASPPAWALDLLRRCVDHVDATGQPFAVGDFVPLPDSFGPDATLCGATFVQDPSFEPAIGPFGRVTFRQLVGLTTDELDTTMATHDGRVIQALRAADPWLVTDPRRASVFDGPHAPARAAAPTALQRSAPVLQATEFRLARSIQGQRECHFGPDVAVTAAMHLAARLPAALTFEVISDAADVRFSPGEASSVVFGDVVELTLAPDALEALVTGLRAGGRGPIALPGLTELAFRVVDR